MMKIEQRIEAFSKLGQYLSSLDKEVFQSLADKVRNENPWFTEPNVSIALQGIIKFLKQETLQNWISSYTLSENSKTVALVLAGNIPLVGFHDFLTVLMAGHKVMLKLSTKDSVLMHFIIDTLVQIEPGFKEQIILTERLKDFDAVIATGSDNSARYFEYYFGKYPHIIRKNRTSVAILNGNETSTALQALANDVFRYYGLGCRSVSKLYVPEKYNFNEVFENWNDQNNIIHHHKYCNNYDYQKSILLINRVPFLDNGFVMLQQNEKLVSPISVVFYETYDNQEALKFKIESLREKIQCIVGNNELATVPFGEAQCPAITDYADNVDTLDFLTTSIHSFNQN